MEALRRARETQGLERDNLLRDAADKNNRAQTLKRLAEENLMGSLPTDLEKRVVGPRFCPPAGRDRTFAINTNCKELAVAAGAKRPFPEIPAKVESRIPADELSRYAKAVDDNYEAMTKGFSKGRQVFGGYAAGKLPTDGMKEKAGLFYTKSGDARHYYQGTFDQDPAEAPYTIQGSSFAAGHWALITSRALPVGGYTEREVKFDLNDRGSRQLYKDETLVLGETWVGVDAADYTSTHLGEPIYRAQFIRNYEAEAKMAGRPSPFAQVTLPDHLRQNFPAGIRYAWFSIASELAMAEPPPPPPFHINMTEPNLIRTSLPGIVNAGENFFQAATLDELESIDKTTDFLTKDRDTVAKAIALYNKRMDQAQGLENEAKSLNDKANDPNRNKSPGGSGAGNKNPNGPPKNQAKNDKKGDDKGGKGDGGGGGGGAPGGGGGGGGGNQNTGLGQGNNALDIAGFSPPTAGEVPQPAMYAQNDPAKNPQFIDPITGLKNPFNFAKQDGITSPLAFANKPGRFQRQGAPGNGGGGKPGSPLGGGQVPTSLQAPAGGGGGGGPVGGGGGGGPAAGDPAIFNVGKEEGDYRAKNDFRRDEPYQSGGGGGGSSEAAGESLIAKAGGLSPASGETLAFGQVKPARAVRGQKLRKMGIMGYVGTFGEMCWTPKDAKGLGICEGRPKGFGTPKERAPAGAKETSPASASRGNGPSSGQLTAFRREY